MSPVQLFIAIFSALCLLWLLRGALVLAIGLLAAAWHHLSGRCRGKSFSHKKPRKW
jgi:hypothetical protein